MKKGITTPKKKLLSENSSLAKEWHPTKNGLLTPLDVTHKSHKKVWWQCKNDHEWQSIISNRTLGRGCPFCAGQRVTKETSLATLNPKLAKEWHPTKNEKLTPNDFTTGSSRKKIWWICANGHEWEAIVKSRSNGCGCPYCSSQKVSKTNSLAAINPLLAKEWHPTKNGQLSSHHLTSSSGKIVWWICKKGHEYRSKVDNKAKGRGCPYCSNKKVCEDNSLATMKPDLAREWHSTKNGKLTSKDVTPGACKKVWWVCKKSHEWQAIVLSRSRGSGCPFCHSQTSITELRIYTELKYIFPDVKHRKKFKKVECDIYLPTLKIGIEHDGEYWHRNKQEKDLNKNLFFKKNGINLIRVREKGLEKITVYDIIYDLTKKKDKQLVDKIFKKIKLLSGKSSHTNTRIDRYLKRSRLVNNAEFIQLLDMLPSPFPGNSFADHNPSITKEWHPRKNGSLTARGITMKSNKKIWWQCKMGHEWQSTANNRAVGSGCPFCAGQRVTKETSLASKNPKLAKEWHPTKNGKLTPEDVMPGSHKKVWWQCSKGHEYISIIYNKLKGNGCPYCSNKKVCEDNCLATVKPDLAREWHSTKNGKLASKDVTPGASKKVWWVCKKGHEWQARIADRTSKGNGCPYCSGRRKSIPSEQIQMLFY
jgi:hypothetical protein